MEILRYTSVLLLTLCWASLGGEIPREYKIKAVFLFNFAQFTDWPSEAFADKDSPIIIGILGTDPFGTFLDDTVHGEVVNGRRLEVHRYTKVAETKSCHILYIAQSEANRLDHIVSELKTKPVLTVSDIKDAAGRGVMIGFMTDLKRIRLKINAEAAKTANLSLSSKLLRAAVDVIGALEKK